MLGKAISLASQVFEKTKDRGEQPYILHCLFVMDKVKYLGNTAMICAVLHDVVEDCPEITWEYMQKEFGDEVTLILQLLTHRKETDYMDYIKALSVHPIAKEIKKADLEHNSRITRLKGLRKKDLKKKEKYFRAYEYLKD